MKIPTKLDSNWPSGLREEDYNVKAYRRRWSGRWKCLT
jgi:hypothetical protein